MMADVTKEERWRELAMDEALRLHVAMVQTREPGVTTEKVVEAAVTAEKVVAAAEVFRKFLAGEER